MSETLNPENLESQISIPEISNSHAEWEIQSIRIEIGKAADTFENSVKYTWVGKEKEIFFVKLGADEAIANGVKHGNKEDADKKVQILVDVDPKQLTVIVKDQGKGFDRTKIPDPRDKQNLLKPSGRGLLYMYKFFDEVSYNQEGNEVTLILKRDTKTSRLGVTLEELGLV